MLITHTTARYFTVLGALVALTSASGCGKGGSSAPSCTVPLTGTSWSPAVPGASVSNHDSTVSVTTSVTQHTATLIGLQEPVTDGKLLSVPVVIGQDLGAFGSITLQGLGNQMPTALVGNATPFLIKLVDTHGTDWVNLPRSGGSDCLGLGLYDCSNPQGCVSNAACSPQWPSAWTSREQWEQHQLLATGANYPSVNVLPTCDWATSTGNVVGANEPTNAPKCPFTETTSPAGNTPWLSSGKLPQGTYTAYFALVATEYASLSGTGYTGGFQLSVVTKATGASISGAVDLNVILVGTTVVNESRTTKGQQNLNTLFSAVGQYYGQAGVGIKVGSVTAIEWPCETGGDTYANVGTSSLGDMFAAGASLYPNTAGKALNIFLTSTIQNDITSLGSGVIIDGFSGAIGGPVTNGTPASGLVFATFDRMDTYNPNCDSSASTCDVNHVEEAFWNMQTTVTHEMGHFLGLNHPSESAGTTHDALYDTPTCTTTDGSLGVLTINSCLNENVNQPFSSQSVGMGQQHSCHQFCAPYTAPGGPFCPAVQECAFNHIMWYTSKNFADSGTYQGTGDGNIFSADTGVVLNMSSYVR